MRSHLYKIHLEIMSYSTSSTSRNQPSLIRSATAFKVASLRYRSKNLVPMSLRSAYEVLKRALPEWWLKRCSMPTSSKRCLAMRMPITLYKPLWITPILRPRRNWSMQFVPSSRRFAKPLTVVAFRTRLWGVRAKVGVAWVVQQPRVTPRTVRLHLLKRCIIIPRRARTASRR